MASNGNIGSSNTLFSILNPTTDSPSTQQQHFPAPTHMSPVQTPQLTPGRGSPTIASLLTQDEPISVVQNKPDETHPVAVSSLLSPLPVESKTPTPAQATNQAGATKVQKQHPVTNTPSPQAKKQKMDYTPGLSSNALLGIGGMGSPGMSSTKTEDIPDICLHVALHGKMNVVVDFGKLAENKYGWESLHPQIASAAAELFDDDGGADDFDESGGEEDDKADTPAGGEDSTTKKPARVRKTEGKYGRYDTTDPFIDDSEMLFEEQAASTKDGFFVFSGPLIADQDQVRIERADGTIKRGGRGRGSKSGGTTRGTKRAATDPSHTGQAPPVAIAPAPGSTVSPAPTTAPKRKRLKAAKVDKSEHPQAAPSTVIQTPTTIPIAPNAPASAVLAPPTSTGP
ncbi:hypothetical protein V1512DRAFT_264852 [Lipomyces arxii]|uniref:uncharacterized protein n=1 Tax=Lipomyces arxii TaxID=56418 RepID=UPI0034CD413D